MPLPTLEAAIENAAAAWRDLVEDPNATQAQISAARLALETARENYWAAVRVARDALAADSTLLPATAAGAQGVAVRDLGL